MDWVALSGSGRVVGEHEAARTLPWAYQLAALFGAIGPSTVVDAARTTIARTASYEYDFKGKRWKTTTPEGSMSTNQSHVLILQERNSGNTPQVQYTRGLDLSGTIEGAGGIGGLLMRSHGYSAGNWSTVSLRQACGTDW